MPGEPVNTLREDFQAEFQGVLGRLAEDQAVRAIVITSGKPEGFIAGADVQMLSRARTAQDASELSRAGQAAMDKLEACSRTEAGRRRHPRACLGGGYEVALACRYASAATTRRRIGLPETQLGLLPGAGGTQRLPQLIGLIADGLDLILAGKRLKAPKAKKLGIVDELVPQAGAPRRWRSAALASWPSGKLRHEPRRVAVSSRSQAPALYGRRLKELAFEDNPVGRQVCSSQAKQKLLKRRPAAITLRPRSALDVGPDGAEHGFEAGLEAEIA